MPCPINRKNVTVISLGPLEYFFSSDGAEQEGGSGVASATEDPCAPSVAASLLPRLVLLEERLVVAKRHVVFFAFLGRLCSRLWGLGLPRNFQRHRQTPGPLRL